MMRIALVIVLSSLFQSTIATAGGSTQGLGIAPALIVAAADPTPGPAATTTPLDDQRVKNATWMRRSKELGQGVRIEDLRLVSIAGSSGVKIVAVIGRVVNQNTVALSLLAIHIAMSGPGAPGGNVAILRRNVDRIAPGVSRDFGFALDAGATSGFAPLDPLPVETTPISDEDALRLGNVSAYVTYAGE
jgi:hypothetical protein